MMMVSLLSPPAPAAVCLVPCVNGGTCSAPDTCTCPDGFTGDTCESECHRKLAKPVFTSFNVYAEYGMVCARI